MTARLVVQLLPKFENLFFLKFLKNLVVASLDKVLYDKYSCLVESDKQQIKEVKSINSTRTKAAATK